MEKNGSLMIAYYGFQLSRRSKMAHDFDAFIGLNDGIDQFIEKVNKINWFSACGNNYTENLAYDYVLEESIETARKNLSRYNNYAGIITTINLLHEGSGRIYSYLKNHKKVNLSLLANLENNSWVNLREKIISKFKVDNIVSNDDGVLTFKNIDEKYYKALDFKKPTDTFV
jgi:hypothetical protein